MIIEKSNGLLDQVPTPLEPPPDYETASRIPERGPSTPTPSYSASRPPRPTASSSSSQPRLSDARHHNPPLQPQLDGGKRWFGLFGGHTAQEKETRSTVLGLVGALLQQPYDDASVSILDSCAEACADQGIVFSSLLQERSFEGRTPLYWAIVKLAGPNSDTASSGERALVLALLAHCAPLLPNTRSEITLACVAASDNALYQTFRAMPEFGTVAGADRMLLGLDVQPPLDRAVVEEVLDEPLLFVVNFQFSHFQKRMRAGGKVGCSFIARGRLFKLVVHVDKDAPGTWALSLHLGEHSAPTHFDSRLIIEDQTAQQTGSGSNPLFKPKVRPPINLRLTREYGEKLQPPSPHSRNSGILLKLDDHSTARNLQYDGCPYISTSGALYARLEAKLAKAETDCVIC